MSEETKKAPEAETSGPAGAQTGSEETAAEQSASPSAGADTAGVLSFGPVCSGLFFCPFL